jgi:hypothetical protein
MQQRKQMRRANAAWSSSSRMPWENISGQQTDVSWNLITVKTRIVDIHGLSSVLKSFSRFDIQAYSAQRITTYATLAKTISRNEVATITISGWVPAFTRATKSAWDFSQLARIRSTTDAIIMAVSLLHQQYVNNYSGRRRAAMQEYTKEPENRECADTQHLSNCSLKIAIS